METLVWKGPDLDWPSDATLPDLLAARVSQTPAAVLLVDGATGRSLSAAELAGEVGRAVGVLRDAGVRRGDVVCTLMGNEIAWCVTVLAAEVLGAAIAGIGPGSTPEEIDRQIALLPARCLLAVPALIGRARDVAERRPGLAVLSTDAGHGVPSLADGECSAAVWMEGPGPIGDPGAAALVTFSSGSTGLPKAAVVSHRNLVAAAAQVADRLGVDAESRLLGLAPMFHIVGPQLFATALLSGAGLVLVPRPDPLLVFDALERHGVTHMPLLTPVMRLLSRHPAGEGRDYGRLRVVGAGGSAMAPVDQAEAAARFGCPVIQVYGMTEAASCLTMDDPADPAPGTAGRPMALSMVRIVDSATGALQPAGREGEIHYAGPNVFSGYLGDAAATAESLTADGFLRTGDLGRMRPDGRLVITGRIKELIKVNSGQVAPAELEMLLCGHRAVAEAAVIGRANRYTGEVPVAYLVLREPADPWSIVDDVNDGVARHKRIRSVEVVERLPKGPTGKLDRKALTLLDATGSARSIRAA